MSATNNMINLPIAAVERDTGLGKDTLRVWERRYGFPRPLRDANGDRLYPADQVARLRHIKRLMDKGHRPGKLLALGSEELAALSERAFEGQGPWSRGVHTEELSAYLEDCRLHRIVSLRTGLMEAMARRGLRDFVLEIAAPLVTAVGDCWERGTFQVYEEHLFTEVLQNVLRVGIAGIPASGHSGPVIVLTTFPQEQHSIGLLMAEAIFTLEGAHCVPLGVSLPVADIARAAGQADVVALSFSIASNTQQMLAGLSELSATRPPGVELWCGGTAVGLARCSLPGLRHVDLATAGEQVAEWRRRAGKPGP
ncbi:MerR family transcriptional regulator [Pseudoduganella sp. GCM10020061]|uniref:MerR family transcriptional regulator n=1 Tax=Pseudoduganella sp. GCM10020061 TaxID=3317345 RepID=UPI00362FAC5A